MKVSNKKKNQRLRFTHRKPKNKCLHCGKPGSHYVPPCFGDPGFYVCAKPVGVTHG